MHSTLKLQRWHQRGVYAMEWAIVFPVFFVVLYAIVGYGLTFLVRESMQYAVEEGARAALKYQPSRQQRFQTARQVVHDGLNWLPATLKPELSDVQVQVCRLASAFDCGADLVCGADTTSRCVVSVSVVIPYGLAPLAPPLPGFGIFLPQNLSASASVLAERGGM